jgi:hypothetical protein
MVKTLTELSIFAKNYEEGGVLMPKHVANSISQY